MGFDGIDGMGFNPLIEAMQTVALGVVAIVISITFLMLRREFSRAGDTLRQVLASQQKLLDDQQHQIDELGRVWIRTEENSVDIRALKAEVDRLRRP